MILGGLASPLAPVISVSCADTLRDILSGNGIGVFEPDAKCMHLPNAKAHLPGFCINLYSEHAFTTAAGVHHVEPAGSYQSQFYWHDGEGRLTMDPLSTRTMDITTRKSISHPFAYHGLPYLLQPVFASWHERPQSSKPTTTPPADYSASCLGSPSLRDMHKVIHAQHLGVCFDGTSGWALAWTLGSHGPAHFG